ncbi:MAG: precorrin-3B C(17)-methyltransferase [Emergencia sp.]|nr:precorrin-3B C(17)-methyltransferase [Emergencia sp.]
MKIYVVGIGPGNREYMTPQAAAAIEVSDVIVGYTLYVDLVRELTEGKEIKSTAMKQEVDRCRMALESALEGKTVAFVCSGDAGVYGMAGVMAEVAEGHPEVEIVTVPGITAACSGAAVLGAPLIHDFAVISLSDLLTPWEKIEKRLRLSAEADFVVCLYNPKSKKRHDYIDKAAEIVSAFKGWDTPCGYVKNIGRDGEKGVICTLADLKNNEDIDMFTTVFVGNSQTKIINGKLVTPRGYKGV